MILVLFGAPLTTHIPHTILAAAHISYLAAVPVIYAFGVDGAKWRELVALMVPADEVFGAAVGTLVGAWAGAVPIPLDWWVHPGFFAVYERANWLLVGTVSGRSGLSLLSVARMPALRWASSWVVFCSRASSSLSIEWLFRE